MKLTTFFARLAALGLAAFLAALVFDAAALGWFAFTASSLLLLVAAVDYAPRRRVALEPLTVSEPIPMPMRQPWRLAA